MSTKIYDGLRFKTTNLMAIQACLEEIRAHVRVQAREFLADRFVTRAIDLYDEIALGLRTVPEDEGETNAMSTTFTEMFNERRESDRTGSRCPNIDADFSLCVIPVREADEVVGIMFSERHDWKNWVLEHPLIEGFHYQNQTDKPDDVSDEDWDYRERLWNLALPDKHPTPAENGLTAEMVDKRLVFLLPYDRDFVLDPGRLERLFQRDRRARARRQLVLVEAMAGAQEQQGVKKDHSIHGFMRLMHRLSEWRETPAGEAAATKLLDDLAEALPPLTKTDITELPLKDVPRITRPHVEIALESRAET